MKYLAVIVDRFLTFESHVLKVCAKLSSRTGLLWRGRPFIILELARMLYVSLIHPHLVYADFILQGTTKYVLDCLRVHQNNALRVVLKADYKCPSITLTSQAKVEPVNVMMSKSTCKIVYKGLHNMGAPIYNEMFNFVEPA